MKKKTTQNSNGHIKYLNNYAKSITFKRPPQSLNQNLLIFRQFSAPLEGTDYDQNNGPHL